MLFNVFDLKTYSHLSYIDRIKLLMMVVMTIGHIAWAFVPTDTPLSQLLHFLARMTIPLACFLVVEGYRLSKDVWAYLRRLFVFGILAQLPFALYIHRAFMGESLNTYHQIIGYGNVLFTLGFGLLTVVVLDKIRRVHLTQKIPHLMLLPIFALCAAWSDWGVLVIFWVSAIFYGGAWGFLVVSIGLFIMSFLVKDDMTLSAFVFSLQTGELMDYGVFLTVPIMLWYQKSKRRSPMHYRLPRLLFYWYYVIHLLLLGGVSAFVSYV